MTSDESDAQPSSYQQSGVTQTLTPEEINWVSHHKVDRLTRWHFGWTVLGSLGGIFLSSGICGYMNTGPAEALSLFTKGLLGAGGALLVVSWVGFWVQVWWRKRNWERRRPVDGIKLGDTTAGATS